MHHGSERVNSACNQISISRHRGAHTHQAHDVGTTPKYNWNKIVTLFQTKFRRCFNVKCPLGRTLLISKIELPNSKIFESTKRLGMCTNGRNRRSCFLLSIITFVKPDWNTICIIITCVIFILVVNQVFTSSFYSKQMFQCHISLTFYFLKAYIVSLTHILSSLGAVIYKLENWCARNQNFCHCSSIS